MRLYTKATTYKAEDPKKYRLFKTLTRTSEYFDRRISFSNAHVFLESIGPGYTFLPAMNICPQTGIEARLKL